jgi:hypothetical protein
MVGPRVVVRAEQLGYFRVGMMVGMMDMMTVSVQVGRKVVGKVVRLVCLWAYSVVANSVVKMAEQKVVQTAARMAVTLDTQMVHQMVALSAERRAENSAGE